VLGYLVWMLSLGQPGNVLIAFVLAMTLGAGLAGAAATALVQARGVGQDERFAISVLVLPGAVLSALWFGPESLALAFGLAGLALWLKARPAPVLAALVFALGGLTRETTLIIPAVLVVVEIVRATGPVGARIRRVLPLAIAPGAYLGWLLVVRLRLGVSTAPRGTLSLPFVGLSESIGGWGTGDVVIALAMVGLAGAALIRCRDLLIRGLVAAFVAVAVVLGALVWGRWEDFARVLLPGTAIAVLGLLPGRDPASPRP
jgi:hypothetical protein